MLADRVRMILGGMKGMKTQKITLIGSNNYNYIDLNQDVGLNGLEIPITTTGVELDVGRYIILTTTQNVGVPGTLWINENMEFNNVTWYTQIGGSSRYGIGNVYIFDLLEIKNSASNTVDKIETLQISMISNPA